MKKTITFFKTMLLAVILLVGSGVHAETATLQLSSTTKFGTSSGSTLTQNSVTWTATSTAGAIQNSWQTAYLGQQFGTTATAWTGTFTAPEIAGATITQIAIRANTGGSATLAAMVGTTSFLSGSSATVSVTKNSSATEANLATYTFTGSATGAITITVSNTSKAFYLNNIVVTYSTASSCTNPTYSFASASVSKLTTDAAFSNTFTTNNTSTKVWSSTNDAVATVDAAGLVTIHSAGTTSIKVNQAADATYCAVVDASYALTVTAPGVAEPTNQPTELSATTNSTSQITVTWADATGAQLPEHYLVKASTGTITAPVDGTAEADAALVKNIAQGTETAVFTGLDASTTYNFSIWPYTNSGAAIDYKTDGIVATASATTETPLGVPVATAATAVTPTGFTANWGAAAAATGYDVNVYTKTSGATASDLFISEYIEAAPGNRKAIQIFNGTGADVILTDVYSLKLGVNGAGLGSTTNSTIALTGTVAAGDVFVIAYGTDGGYTTNQVSTYLSFNGDDAIGLFKNNELLDVFGTPGTDPGAGWAIGGTSNATVDHIITRNASVMSPVTTWNTDEWTLGAAYSSATGDAAAAATLTSHSFAGGSTNAPISGSPFTVTETSKAVSGLNPDTQYFYTVVAKNATGSSVASNEISVTTPKITFTGTGEWTETARWNTDAVPGITAQVVVDGDAIINSNVEVAGLTINAGKSLTVNAAKQLTISGTATNNGTITIQSDANGTGTIKGDVSGAATVNQHLSSYRTWYLSSPVSNVAPSNMDRYKFYDETTGNWSTTAPAQTIGAGFLAVPTNNTVTSTSFTGTLNSGNVSIDVTRSVGNGAKPGFNLVGNPYPSYLDWSEVNTANSSLMPTSTMWYRTKKRNQSDELVYQFWTVNGNGVGSPSGASQYIPPMQAFWVRAKASGQFQLTNDMRSHAVGEDYLLKAPAANRRTLIRLELSNGTNTDETVLYLSDNANNGLDAFDAPKMSNEDATIAEIFTRAGNEKLVINALQTLPKDTEIALGFEAGSATSFTLRANELSNLPTDVKLILKDNVTKAETDLTDGTAVYSFGDIATSGDRFSIIFRTAGAVTGIDQPTFSGLTAYSNANNQLTVLYDGTIDANTVVSVYNAVGQRLVTQSLMGVSTVIDGEFAPGVYVVKVNNLSRKLTIKN